MRPILLAHRGSPMDLDPRSSNIPHDIPRIESGTGQVLASGAAFQAHASLRWAARVWRD